MLLSPAAALCRRAAAVGAAQQRLLRGHARHPMLLLLPPPPPGPRGYSVSAAAYSSSGRGQGQGQGQEEAAAERPRAAGRVVTITSGKGGVGKTTTAASFAYGLAERGHTTCVIDFDIGLRNLDIHLGCERRVIFDFVNVILEECTLNQALIRDKRCPNLSLLAASQTKDKTVLTEEGVGKVLDALKERFDYVVCDSPAGIESGAIHAMYYADDAIIVTNPELSSCRDSDKMIGFIYSRSRRALEGLEPVNQTLLVTRYDPERVEREESLSLDDICELLGLPILGVIPESKAVLTSTNIGQPVILKKDTDRAAQAYEDMVTRFLGEEVPLRFLTAEKPGFFAKLFA